MTKQFSVKQFLSDIERDIMFHLILNTKRGQWSYENAKELASKLLTAQKRPTVEEFLNSLACLATTYPELHDVYLRYAPQFYEYSRNEKLSQMRAHTRSCQYDKAIEAASQCMCIERT